MRIACPSCAAAYDVPEALLAGRKSVRCARCSNDWRPEALPVHPAEPEMPRTASIPQPVLKPRARIAEEAPLPQKVAPHGEYAPAPDEIAPEGATREGTTSDEIAPDGIWITNKPLGPAPLTAMERLAQSARRPGNQRSARLGWAASALVLALFAWGIVAWRGDLMQAWPPSMRFYSALGLAHASQ